MSRISGMVRDISMAAVFGDHPSVAAFMVAFRFSHFLRRLFGEGVLQSIFIPNYEELRIKDEQRASCFFFRLTGIVAVLLFAIVMVVEGFAFFNLSNPESQEVLRLFAWMFPSLIFICLYGLNISLLQCRDSFFISSVAPFACNLIWIVAIFLFAKQSTEQAMVNLALFTLIGFIVQWTLTLPKTWGVLSEGKSNNKDSIFVLSNEMRAIGKATLFGLLGVTAVQINSFLDMVFARYADLKGPVYLWYAIRLEQFPLALIGFACVYSIVPSLSREIKANAMEKAKELFFFGHQRIFLLVIPCTFALFALSFSSVNLLFGRGHFSQDAVTQTSLCLWAYGLSLLPSTLTIYQSSLFYAFGNYKMPAAASLISVGISIVLNSMFVFAFHWGAISIALSTSLSSWVNYWILKRAFTRKNYMSLDYPKTFAFSKLSGIALAAFGGCLFIDQFFLGSMFFQESLFISPRSFFQQSLHFLIQLISFAAIFLTGLLLFQKEMLFTIKNLIFSKSEIDPSRN